MDVYPARTAAGAISVVISQPRRGRPQSVPSAGDREPVRRAEAAALSFGMTVTLAPVHGAAEIEEAIDTHARDPGGSPLIVGAIYYPGLAD